MSEVVDLAAYRARQERPTFDEARRQHLRERLGDLAIEIALLESERDRLERVLNLEA